MGASSLLTLAAGCLLAAPSQALAPAYRGATCQEELAPARSGDLAVTWEELDRLLVDRFAMSQDGRFALQHLAQTAVLARLAEEANLEIADADVDRLWSELDRAAREQGRPGGLADELRQKRLEPEAFFELLRLTLVQAELTRRALRLPDGAAVNGDQQTIWLEQEMAERGLSAPPPPWPDGVAARCGDVEVPADSYARMLRSEISADLVRDACVQLLLAKRLRERMPDLSAEALEAAVEREVARRRAEAAENPLYQGVPFEDLLRAQGIALESLSRDPAVVASALAEMWIERTHGEEGLREAYESERALFERLYGESVRARLLFLGAARRTNPLQERSFAQAKATLAELLPGLANEAAFAEAAKALSEDPYTRPEGGALGWVTRGARSVPEGLREELFEALDAGGDLPPGGRVVGPFELENGAALLWIAERRPSPGWDVMARHVRAELKSRLAEDVLSPDSVETFLDQERGG